MYAYVFISESIKSLLLHLVIKRWGGIRLISINNKHSKSLLHIKPLFSYNLEYLEVLLPTSLWHSLQPLAMFGSNCSMFVLIYPPAQKVYGTYTISKFLTMYILTMVYINIPPKDFSFSAHVSFISETLSWTLSNRFSGLEPLHAALAPKHCQNWFLTFSWSAPCLLDILMYVNMSDFKANAYSNVFIYIICT